MNNFERIKNMTVEEMARFFSSRAFCAFCVYECEEGIKQWLLEECEE